LGVAAGKQWRQRRVFHSAMALFFAASGIFPSGCSSAHEHSDTHLPKRAEEIRYFDRNGDGKVDLEYHHYPGAADMDWELRDDNYDGRYEKKILYGFAVLESKVDIPVPTNVPISPNPKLR
jgi:hypothetical protein